MRKIESPPPPDATTETPSEVLGTLSGDSSCCGVFERYSVFASVLDPPGGVIFGSETVMGGFSGLAF